MGETRAALLLAAARTVFIQLAIWAMVAEANAKWRGRTASKGGILLQRIESVRGVGLFAEAKGAAQKLEQTALIYGGNGRGKTTLSSILRAASSGDAAQVEARRTIDGVSAPEVTLQFKNGHKVTYANGAWSESRAEIRVFDTAFIEENVYSGGEVTSEHRRNLLSFALGDRAVAAQHDEEAAVLEQQTASADIKTISSQLGTYAGGKTIAVFRSILPVDEAVNRLAALSKRMADARGSDAILRQPMPRPIGLPELDLDALFTVLNRTLEDVHKEAEDMVASHLEWLDNPAAASWLSQGQQFDDQLTCPYCAQSTANIPLIKMYQSHFNEAYQALKSEIAAAEALVERKLRPEAVDTLLSQRANSNLVLMQWAVSTNVGQLDDSGDELALTSLANLGDLLRDLFARKAVAPTDELGSPEEAAEAGRLWRQFLGVFADQNEVILAYSSRIEAFKEGLKSESLDALAGEISNIELAVVRHSEAVTALVGRLASAETRLKAAEQAKATAREKLTTVMTSTLAKYRTDINSYLLNLGAAFSIGEIKTNFLGSSPRTDYAIILRGKSVKLTGGRPSFATALSEGDKRTLAFAFFVASTLADPSVGSQIAVVDDPVSSLDRSRREYTAELLVQISERCSQLILLGHDASFLRDALHRLERRATPGPISTIQIQRTVNDYSDFALIDLDKECETPYYSNYRLVDEFVSGMHSDAKGTAIALRPLLEGYLHRRFPGKLPSSSMLGVALGEIDSAKAPNPLVHIQHQVQELRDLNSFAGQFHHDTNPGYATHTADPASVAAFGKRVLNVLHGA